MVKASRGVAEKAKNGMPGQGKYKRFLLSGFGVWLSACAQASTGVQPVVIAFGRPASETEAASGAVSSVSATAVTNIDIKIRLPEASPPPAPIASAPPVVPNTPAPVPTPVLPPAALPTAVPVTVSSVSIAPPASTRLTIGETLNLSASILLSDGSGSQAVSWTSSNPAIAGVDSHGKVTAFRAGSVEINAQASSEPGKKDSLALTVSAPLVTFTGTILYAIKGDLYLLKGNNSQPLRLTSNGAVQQKRFPRLNWDGSQIAFGGQDHSIYTLATDGVSTPVKRQLPVNELNPIPFFLPDGSLLFLAQGSPGYVLGGTGIWRSGNDGSLSLYASTGAIAYIGGLVGDTGILYDQGTFLKRLDLNSKLKTELGPGGDPKLAMTTNPRLVVFNHKTGLNDDIFKQSLQDGSREKLIDTGGNDYHPAISPDESRVIFVSENDGNNSNHDIFMINIDGTGLVNLTNTPDHDESQPSWSN